MNHDLSKLHPVHRKLYKQFQESQYTPDVPDELYLLWAHLNETVPDIIGKQEEEMTKEQKVRYHKKLKETKDLRNFTVERIVDPNNQD